MSAKVGYDRLNHARKSLYSKLMSKTKIASKRKSSQSEAPQDTHSQFANSRNQIVSKQKEATVISATRSGAGVTVPTAAPYGLQGFYEPEYLIHQNCQNIVSQQEISLKQQHQDEKKKIYKFMKNFDKSDTQIISQIDDMVKAGDDRMDKRNKVKFLKQKHIEKHVIEKPNVFEQFKDAQEDGAR